MHNYKRIGAEIMRNKKKICVLLTVAVMLGSFTLPQMPVTVKAEETTVGGDSVSPLGTVESPAEGNLTVSDTFPGKDNLEVLFSQKTQLKSASTLSDKPKLDNYFKFTLAEDAWVYLGTGLSLNNHEGITVKVKLYSDAAFSKEVGYFEYGYWTSKANNEFTDVLKAGTYYGHLQVNHANYGDFDGNINLKGVALPLKNLIKTDYRVSKNKSKATVTVSTGLGELFNFAQFRSGKVGNDADKNATYWGRRNSYGWINSGDRKAVEIKLNDNNTMKFDVKKNGYYTVRVTDKYMVDTIYAEKNATSFSKFFKVKGIDDKAPIVKGVKNGGSYRSGVKIVFSDKDTGIKSAKLNGRSVKSGVTVSTRGSYKLVVKDKAGNSSIISFKVR